MAYEVPEQHVGFLLQACGLSEFDAEGNPTKVPQHVVDSFEKLHRAMNRMGVLHFQPDTYAIAAAFAGEANCNKPGDGKHESVAALWFKKQLQYGDAVTVEWRGEKRTAKILGAAINRKQVTIQLEGDSEERKVPVEAVSLPQMQEAEL